MPEPTYRVKRLVWEQCEPGSFAICVASCVLGEFSIQHPMASEFCESLQDETKIEWEFMNNERWRKNEAESVDAAKLAAESWYRARLLEALEPVEERT